MLPSALHRLQGALVRLVSSCYLRSQMLIFCLYDLVGGISMECEIAWSTHLLACHFLHRFHFLPYVTSFRSPWQLFLAARRKPSDATSLRTSRPSASR